MPYPVSTMVLAKDLKGCTNGMIPDTLLVPPGYPNAKAARLHHITHRAFAALDGTVAAKFGEYLTSTSSADCFRSFAQQEAVFYKRTTTTPVPGARVYQYKGETRYLKPGMAGIATPGKSNHGWASARDTGLLVAGSVRSITTGKCWPWLLDHADEYGICWEAQSEPWHLRYFKGDAIPNAVLAYEATAGGTTPTPPPSGKGYTVDVTRQDVVKGSTGIYAKRCQSSLVLTGATIAVDGQFGDKSVAALKTFQGANGLTADGQCGPQTWAKLENWTD
jgi:peptidoglycan hydrolase-like protein with peptidoglycan-binding domain